MESVDDTCQKKRLNCDRTSEDGHSTAERSTGRSSCREMSDCEKNEGPDQAKISDIEQKLRNYNSILSLMPTNKIRGIVNDLADDLLKSLGPKLKLLNLDPLKLPDRSVEFEKQVCCKTYPGVAELKNGVCRGLSSTRRHGEVGLDMQGGSIEITFSIRVGPVSVTFDSDSTLNNHIYHPTFDVSTEFIDILVHLVFGIKETKMEMQKMKVEEIGAISAEVTNMSIFTRFLVSPVVKHLIESEKKFLLSKLNVDMKDNIKALAENALNVKRWLPTSLFG